MDISVIIPVFNTPPDAFIRCIDSFVHQSGPEYEIIVIDDGSEGHYSEQYKALCEPGNAIRYLKKENGGVSAARNTGIDMAKGKYIVFADADDAVSADFLRKAFEIAEKNDADAVIGRIIYSPEQPVPDQDIRETKTMDNTREIMSSMFPMDEIPPNKALASPCGRIYRAEAVKAVRFDEDLAYFEDQVFNRRLMRQARRVVLVPEDWYIYYQNEFSALHQHKKWTEMTGWNRYWDRWEELNEQEEDEALRKHFRKRTMGLFYMAVFEGVLAGEKYQRKKLLDLLAAPAFRKTAESLHIHDFRSLKCRAEIIMMKRKLTLLIYLTAALYRRMNQGSERTR